MKNTSIIIAAAMIALLLAGCSEQATSSANKALIERRKAEMLAQKEEMMRLAETPAPDAELDEALESAAAQIEAAFAAALAAVNESKANGGSGNCEMSSKAGGTMSSATGNNAITLTKTFSVQNPDGTEWHAVIQKINGVVTKAEREDGPAQYSESDDEF